MYIRKSIEKQRINREGTENEGKSMTKKRKDDEKYR
jgi:hypothetical protein